MSSRAIKEEMLQSIAPEIYIKKQRKLRKKDLDTDPLTESRIDVKTATIRKYKESRKNKKSRDDPIITFQSAPRRAYQWKGRKVNKVLRPGVPVVFSPGIRSREKAEKRQFDEVYGDDDILEQEHQRDGEFAYGKMARYAPQAEVLESKSIPIVDLEQENSYVVLDNHNPTPSLQPITEQKILKTAKRENSDLEPTLQLMRCKKRKMDDFTDPNVAEVHMRPIKEVARGIGVQTVDVKIPSKTSPMEVVEKLRDVATNVGNIPKKLKNVGTNVGIIPKKSVAVNTSIDTIVKNPKKSIAINTFNTTSVGTQTRKITRKHKKYNSVIFPNYSLHPSITPTPDYRGTVFVRSKSAPKRKYRRRRKRRPRKSSSYNNNLLILPAVRYHPTLKQKNRDMVVIRR